LRCRIQDAFVDVGCLLSTIRERWSYRPDRTLPLVALAEPQVLNLLTANDD
jgi:hypothetical protein